jgi:hypothetical protein
VRETELTLGNIDLIKLSQSSVADSGYLIKDGCFSLEKTDAQRASNRAGAWRGRAAIVRAPRETVESLHQQ